MERCPICRATVGDIETCRRCKTDLTPLLRVERTAADLEMQAFHHLAAGQPATAKRLLKRARFLQDTEARQSLDWLLCPERTEAGR